MIALDSRNIFALVALLAVATGCCMSEPKVPSKGLQIPLPAYARSDPAKQPSYQANNQPGTYSAPIGGTSSYLPQVVRKAQQPLYAANSRLLPPAYSNGAKNFNQQALKDDPANKNLINKPGNTDKLLTSGSNGSAAPRIPIAKPTTNTPASSVGAPSATTTASTGNQAQTQQQSPSLADELLKQISVAGPVQTGASNVNINNNVSNIKVGNTKSENIHYGPPTLPRERSLGNRIDPRNRALNDIASHYGGTRGGQSYGLGPRRNPIVYDNQPESDYLFDEGDYFADNGEYGDDGYTGYESPPNKQDELRLRQPIQNQNQNQDKTKKCDKKKKKQKPTAEQVELKNQLLDLASKATSSTVPDDSPLLKFNKETGTLEQVQVDPNAQLYKDKLQEALNALNPKKLTSKKLKKVLLNDDGSKGDDPNGVSNYQGEPQNELKSSRGAQQGGAYNRAAELGELPSGETNQPRRASSRPGDYGNPNGQNYYQQAASEDQYANAGSAYPANNRASSLGSFGDNSDNSEQVDLSTLDEEQKRSLVDQVRAVLNDNLNRYNEVVAFSNEFLEQLLYVSDDELTPIESEFKRLILCNADERYCPRDANQLEPAQQYDDSAPEAAESYPTNAGYDNNQEDPNQQQYNQQYNSDLGDADNNNPYYDQPEEAEDVENPADVGRVRYVDERDDGSQDESTARRGAPLNGDDGRRFSRQYSSDSYVYKQSAGGARNGVPVKPQKHEYAEQSTFLRTNQSPAAVPARPNLVVDRNGVRYTSPAAQLQQPTVRASSLASQSAAPNGPGNQFSASGYSTKQPAGDQVNRSAFVGKPPAVANRFQQAGPQFGPQQQQQQQQKQQQQQQQQQYNQQQQARASTPTGSARTANGGKFTFDNLAGGTTVSGNGGGRILKQQQRSSN